MHLSGFWAFEEVITVTTCSLATSSVPCARVNCWGRHCGGLKCRCLVDIAITEPLVWNPAQKIMSWKKKQERRKYKKPLICFGWRRSRPRECEARAAWMRVEESNGLRLIQCALMFVQFRKGTWLLQRNHYKSNLDGSIFGMSWYSNTVSTYIKNKNRQSRPSQNL